MKTTQVVHHPKTAFRQLCEATNSLYAKEALALFNKSEEEFALTLQMPQPSQYDSADSFRRDYVVYNYLRKYVGLDTKIDKKTVALSKWYAAEEQCAVTNNSLSSGSYISYEAECAILRARRKISRVLGDFGFDKVLRSVGMGPGSSFDVSRRAKPGSKYSLPITVTPECLHLAKAWLSLDMHFAFSRERGILPEGAYSVTNDSFHVVKGNRMSFVPKDSTTDRVICVEPTFNIFLQKGVGGYIRRQLRKFGIDLDLQSRNQELARLAQALGLATLDLSSASDSICIELVKLLLPLDWWLYLDQIRSHYTFLSKDKGWKKLTKWSSMGNGFTFELETLLFWALCPEDSQTSSVYGDDIICDQSSAEEYIKILNGLGFTINKAKSFVDGRFFESCGKHFFDGIEVTPCYQKEEMSSAFSYVRAFNRLFLLADRTGDPLYEDLGTSCYLETYPYKRKPFVPHHADDRGFKTYDLSLFKYDPTRGYKCPVLKIPKLKAKCHSAGLYAKKMQCPGQLVFGPEGRDIYQAGLERNAKLSSSWIQPFVITSEWLPLRADRLLSLIHI